MGKYGKFSMNKPIILLAFLATVFVLIVFLSCGREVNSIADSNFDADGTPLDTTITLFAPKLPES